MLVSNNMKRVLVCTCAYNAGETIARAIESILEQSYSEWENHILNNGSTDSTDEIIRKYAEQDSRIKSYSTSVNDINQNAFFNDLIENTSADWFSWLDADDEYRSDFLEKMVSFAESEKLDVAACGHDEICAQTGETLKRRALGYDLVISGADFAEKFIEYRGFTPGLWAKLTSVELLKQNAIFSPWRPWFLYLDAILSLKTFQIASRAGICGESMYAYYQYPSSTSCKIDEEALEGFDEWWHATKEYIESYGPVSRMNEDFLYAIYLSIIDGNLNLIYASSLVFPQKLGLIKRIFTNPLATETLSRKADPVFRNLAGRKQFVREVINWIESQPERKSIETGEVIALLSDIASHCN